MIFILLSAFKGDTSTPSTKGRSAGYGRSEEQIERGGNGLGTVRIENVGGVRTMALVRVEKCPPNTTDQSLVFMSPGRNFGVHPHLAAARGGLAPGSGSAR